jgi:hypothetical protein
MAFFLVYNSDMDEKLRELVKQRPFTPFRLRLSNGESQVVRRPEQIMLLKSRFVLFKPRSERFRVCDFVEVTKLQMVQAKKSRA